MKDMILAILILITTVLAFATGYCFGKADGIKWTKGIYDEYFAKYSFDAVLKEVLKHIKNDTPTENRAS